MSLIAKQFNPGDPIDINTLNQMIVAINTLATQVAQIYKLPAPQASITVNNNGTTTTQNQDGTTTGGTANTGMQIVTIPVFKDGYAGFNNSLSARKASLTKADVEKQVNRTIKDYKIISVGTGDLSFIPVGQTGRRVADGIRVSTTLYSDNKSWSWKIVKDGFAKYNGGVNAPKTDAPSLNRRVYFAWNLVVEYTY